jgi:hypothetical protein
MNAYGAELLVSTAAFLVTTLSASLVQKQKKEYWKMTEIRFKQIAVSISTDESGYSEVLYGLTEKGKVYEYSLSKKEWIELPMVTGETDKE